MVKSTLNGGTHAHVILARACNAHVIIVSIRVALTIAIPLKMSTNLKYWITHMTLAREQKVIINIEVKYHPLSSALRMTK